MHSIKTSVVCNFVGKKQKSHDLFDVMPDAATGSR